MRIPPDFTRVVPYLFVKGTESYIDFLRSGLGFAELGRSQMPDGSIGNCQMRLNDSTVMISEASEAFGPTAAAFYIYVGDADAATNLAVEAGAERIMEVTDMPYGDRQGGVRDPAGNIWWISQRLVDEAYF